MQVAVYSRKEAEFLLHANCFPKDVAVISFYDPAIRRIDKNYTHVDYGNACKSVFFSELDDLDISCYGTDNQEYNLFFPKADELARFVYRAYNDGLDIICQCEYGQSRSAGCAAAILEHFYHSGITIFADYRRSPNQLVYHKVFDALERYREYEQNPYYYNANPEYIGQLLTKHGARAKWQEKLSFADKVQCMESKEKIEEFLQKRNLLCTSMAQAMDCFSRNREIYLSMRITDFECFYDLGCGPFKVTTYQKYFCEKIPIVMWLGRLKAQRKSQSPFRLPTVDITEGMTGKFDMLARAVWDDEEKTICAVPLIVNI